MDSNQTGSDPNTQYQQGGDGAQYGQSAGYDANANVQYGQSAGYDANANVQYGQSAGYDANANVQYGQSAGYDANANVQYGQGAGYGANANVQYGQGAGYGSGMQYQSSYPGQSQAGIYAQPGERTGTDTKGVVSLIFGILSIVTCCCYGVLSIILGIVGIVLAILAKKDNMGKLSGIAAAGLICSIIGVVMGAIFILCIIAEITANPGWLEDL